MVSERCCPPMLTGNIRRSSPSFLAHLSQPILEDFLLRAATSPPALPSGDASPRPTFLHDLQLSALRDVEGYTEATFQRISPSGEGGTGPRSVSIFLGLPIWPARFDELGLFFPRQFGEPDLFSSPIWRARALFHSNVDGCVPPTQHVNLRLAV